MVFYRCLITCLFMLNAQLSWAQSHIIWLHDWAESSISDLAQASGAEVLRRLSPHWPLYECKGGDLAFWLGDKRVFLAQENRFLSPRNAWPNDPFLAEQWPLRNRFGSYELGLDSAWLRGQGGLTQRGDTLVLAILDDGLDWQHEDLSNNLWINWAEIPNNGLDDDGNGYVDDYRGWHTAGDDRVDGGNHGTAVAGIAGARGNNQLGISGLNWQIKLMIVRLGQQRTEADLVAAYAYVHAQKRLHRQTAGQFGAYVVATTASWGLERLFASDAPIWCAFYDSLGAEGILNFAATTNQDSDVDVWGDLPSTCPSEALLVLTNANRFGQKPQMAGYGREHVDMAAPGDGVYALRWGSAYGGFGGTSAAAPHGAGLAVLLYHWACPRFLDLMDLEPWQGVLVWRSWLMSGLLRTGAFRGLVAGEGVLWARGAQGAMDNWCLGLGASNWGGGETVLRLGPNPSPYGASGPRVWGGQGLKLVVWDMLGVLHWSGYLGEGEALPSLPRACYVLGGGGQFIRFCIR